MTPLRDVSVKTLDLDEAANFVGKIAVFVDGDGKMLGQGTRRINSRTRKSVARFCETKAFGDLKEGEVFEITIPPGLDSPAVLVVKIPGRPDVALARKVGSELGARMETHDLLILGGPQMRPEEMVFGALLRAYEFEEHKTGDKKAKGGITLMVPVPVDIEAAIAERKAIAEGVFFTRDLVTEPANHLTTTSFAERLEAMTSLGLDVEVLEEGKLQELGMGSLLSVGHGSASPSKVVVMKWMGGGDEAPLALVGKGVVFDTGGISLKPAAGMEDMTMDMGGAGVVAGVMRALALRKAKANVVGLVGLVENMPSDRATRPGDVVTSMKGDTIEVINTDAEGRLVLADVLWYAQETFEPVGIVDLATLTGAIIIALGHENTGTFSNDDAFCNAFLDAAEAEGEGAWRLPLAPAYDKLLKSGVADMKNVGGRAAGSITAAQFLQRFIKDGVPWIHLDIAGTASIKEPTAFAPKGATGWGVRALNRLVADRYEG